MKRYRQGIANVVFDGQKTLPIQHPLGLVKLPLPALSLFAPDAFFLQLALCLRPLLREFTMFPHWQRIDPPPRQQRNIELIDVRIVLLGFECQFLVRKIGKLLLQLPDVGLLPLHEKIVHPLEENHCNDVIAVFRRIQSRRAKVIAPRLQKALKLR